MPGEARASGCSLQPDPQCYSARMTSPFDETDFVDRDLQPGLAPRATSAPPFSMSPAPATPRPPNREELEAKVGATQHRIDELKRAQEELERERAALEEARRRRTEFETGRAEMLQHLNRGIGLLEKTEFEARRDAEQMAKTLVGFKEALGQLQAIQEATWTQDSWNLELTRALTTIENARMEWNGARLKWTVLEGAAAPANPSANAAGGKHPDDLLAGRSLGELCKLGLALTWPLALVALLGLLAFGLAMLRR